MGLCLKIQKISQILAIFEINNNFMIFVNLENMFENVANQILLRQSRSMVSVTPILPI